MSTKESQIHIGEAIRTRAKELRIGPTELGQLINTSKQNIYGIYKRSSVDTELLYRLSMALEYDFFALFSPNLNWEKRKKVEALAEEILGVLRGG